jgi:hypothetical protein
VNEAVLTHPFWRHQSEGAWPFQPSTQFLYDNGAPITEAAADMAVDGSVTPVPFHRTCPAGITMIASQFLLYVQDNGVWRESHFAGLGSALTNGIRVRFIKSDGRYHQLTCVVPMRSLATIRAHCYDVSFSTVGAGDSALEARWSLGSMGSGVLMEPGDRFEWLVQDDLSDLTKMYVKLDATIIDGDGYVTP